MLAWIVFAAVMFLWPPQHVPAHADAVVVLAGARGPRLARGLELVRRKVAPVLVVSDGWGVGWAEANRLCAGRRAPAKVVCVRPSPYSTRGEAEAVAGLAKAHGWRSVLVVTSRYHIVRAGILFDRCLGPAVSTDGAGEPFTTRLWAVPFETAKLAYAYTRRGC